MDHAHLGGGHRSHLTAEGVGEQLVTQTDSEVRTVELGHPSADGRFLRGQPGVTVALPHVHRAAHDDEHVEGIEIGHGVALVELDGDEFDATGGEQETQRARMLNGQVLEHECSCHQ